MSNDHRIYHVTESRVVELVAQAIEKNNAKREAELRLVINTTVGEFLKQLGVDSSKPFEMQRNFHHLNNLAENSQAMRRQIWLTMIAVVMTSLFGVIVPGVKSLFGAGP